MSLAFLIELILLIVALAGIFSPYLNQAYAAPGRFVAAICVLLLFLIAAGTLHL